MSPSPPLGIASILVLLCVSIFIFVCAFRCRRLVARRYRGWFVFFGMATCVLFLLDMFRISFWLNDWWGITTLISMAFLTLCPDDSVERPAGWIRRVVATIRNDEEGEQPPVLPSGDPHYLVPGERFIEDDETM